MIMKGMNNSKHEGLWVIPGFGDCSAMKIGLRPSLFHAQLQVCSTAQPASGEKMQVKFCFTSPCGPWILK